MDFADFAIIAFSTFFGAAVALLAERLTRRHDAKLHEEAAINNLILDLAAKRAFLTGPDWEWVEGELERVVGSIIHARTLVRDARLALRPRSPALPYLRTMNQSCNAFLEMSERVDAEQLKGALKDLSRDVTLQVQALHSLRPKRIFVDEPGSAAL